MTRRTGSWTIRWIVVYDDHRALLQVSPSIVFRVDASTEIGTGHVMRCLALAEAAALCGTKSQFICRAHKGNLISKIKERGFDVIGLPADLSRLLGPDRMASSYELWLGTTAVQDAADTIGALQTSKPDWLVVDHYGIGRDWEEQLRPYCSALMCIDDLADRLHDCDVLLDHGLGPRRSLYTNLVPPAALLLCGPEYAPLRPEFAALRDESLARRRSPRLRHLLVSMGGADKENATGAVLKALAYGMDLSKLDVTVVLGPSAPWLHEVQAATKALAGQIRLIVDTPLMAELMRDADLIFGAAGTSSWERCCLGVPSVVLAIADNQLEVAKSLEVAGAAFVLKDQGALQDFILRNREKLASSSSLAEMAKRAARITDGHGAKKVVEKMLSELRLA